MKPTSDTSVLAIAINGKPEPDLQRIVLRNSWLVVEPSSASAAFEEILHRRPIVSIVQASTAPDEAAEFIRLVRADRLPVHVVAVAASHRDEIERAVRIAGVDSYLDGIAIAAILEDTVAELLEQRQKANLKTASRRLAPRRPERNLSLLLFPTDMSGGPKSPAAHFRNPGERVRSQYSATNLRSRSPRTHGENGSRRGLEG